MNNPCNPESWEREAADASRDRQDAYRIGRDGYLSQPVSAKYLNPPPDAKNMTALQCWDALDLDAPKP